MSTLEMHNTFDEGHGVELTEVEPVPGYREGLMDMANSWPAQRTNPSGLSPRGHAVLVKPYEPEVTGQLIVLPAAVRDGMLMLEQRAVVIAVGPNSWVDEVEPRALPGDKVMIAKYAGVGAVGPLDGVQYRIVNDRDIYCVLEEPK